MVYYSRVWINPQQETGTKCRSVERSQPAAGVFVSCSKGSETRVTIH